MCRLETVIMRRCLTSEGDEETAGENQGYAQAPGRTERFPQQAPAEQHPYGDTELAESDHVTGDAILQRGKREQVRYGIEYAHNHDRRALCTPHFGELRAGVAVRDPRGVEYRDNHRIQIHVREWRECAQR